MTLTTKQEASQMSFCTPNCETEYKGRQNTVWNALKELKKEDNEVTLQCHTCGSIFHHNKDRSLICCSDECSKNLKKYCKMCNRSLDGNVFHTKVDIDLFICITCYDKYNKLNKPVVLEDINKK